MGGFNVFSNRVISFCVGSKIKNYLYSFMLCRNRKRLQDMEIFIIIFFPYFLCLSVYDCCCFFSLSVCVFAFECVYVYTYVSVCACVRA